VQRGGVTWGRRGGRSWRWTGTHLDDRGLRAVQVGSSGVDVRQVGGGVRGGPPAVLLQDVPVGSGVQVCPPHQHLGGGQMLYCRQFNKVSCYSIGKRHGAPPDSRLPPRRRGLPPWKTPPSSQSPEDTRREKNSSKERHEGENLTQKLHSPS